MSGLIARCAACARELDPALMLNGNSVSYVCFVCDPSGELECGYMSLEAYYAKTSPPELIAPDCAKPEGSILPGEGGLTNFVISTAALMIRPKGEPLFSEQVTTVRIEDEAGGDCFVVVEQQGDSGLGKIKITPEEWPAIKAAIETMLKVCETINTEEEP